MGSPADEQGRNKVEGPQHAVTISAGLWSFDTRVTGAGERGEEGTGGISAAWLARHAVRHHCQNRYALWGHEKFTKFFCAVGSFRTHFT
jgi:hypothetical protein